MNERVDKRMVKAEAYFGGEGVDYRNFDPKKFAELIVRECGNWVNSRLVVEPDYGLEHRVERNRAVVGVMKEFNQHFGVEEKELNDAMD